MNEDTQNRNFVEIALVLFAFLFSLIGSVLTFATEFGGMYIGPPSYYAYFCLGCEYLAGWSKLFIVLIGLILLALAVIGAILTLMKLNLMPEKNINLYLWKK